MLKKLKTAVNQARRGVLSERKATDLIQLGYSEVKYLDLLQAICQERKSDVLEIFGSGWSLASTVERVNLKSYKMGFNFSGYALIDFDLYFFENTANNYLGDAQRELLNSIKARRLLLKNLWSPNVDVAQIASKKYPNFQFIHDVWVPQDKNRSFSQVKSIVEDRENYSQIGATFISMVAMGIQCGFKTIVLHGIDFMGEHFFHSPDTKFSAPFNYGRLDCPDGKFDDYLYGNTTVASKDFECANYISFNIIHDAVLLRALFVLAAEKGVVIRSHTPSVSMGILR